jgi:YD repeat-containing protein
MISQMMIHKHNCCALLLWVMFWLVSAFSPVQAVEFSSPFSIIHQARFAEPLVATAPTTAADDGALAAILAKRSNEPLQDQTAALAQFAALNPTSGWSPAVLTNLGLSYLHDGAFSRAIEAFEAAWTTGKTATDPRAKALADRAIGELARLYMNLGEFEKLEQLFDEIGDRPISGSATEAVQQARETLALLTKDPRHLFNCGPVALKRLILNLDPKTQSAEFLQWQAVGPKGSNLADLETLAARAKLPAEIVFRKPGEPVPIPSLVHWKLGHFAAIVGDANGRYHVEDPGFPGEALWVTPEALDQEASGYFLVPSTHIASAARWRTVSSAEAAKVWGKGPTAGTQPGDAGDHEADDRHSNCGMCGYNIKESAVSLILSDLPVGYDPPVGPSTRVRISYNQREDSQPANFGFFNVSPKWTLNWLSYVSDDPTNPGGNVSRYLPGGGAYYYTNYGAGRFAAQTDDGSILVLASQNPVTYRLQRGDGSVAVYAQSDGSPSYPRRVFLKQEIDPQGNAVTLNYDSQLRLTSLTDATGRQTTFTYGLSASPLLVTKITDPFGRSAALTYDSSKRLQSITDVIGLTSQFAYDANSLVNQLTTPYGTTSFSYTAPGTNGPPRFVDVTDPLGFHEREEWLEPAPIPDSDPAATVPTDMPITPTNQYLTYRNSFYWDKTAYTAAGCSTTGGCDYTKARITHFLHIPNSNIKSTAVESVKNPLENRIWYETPGQTSSIYGGTFSKPIATARVLDDGTTQMSRGAYDTTGYFNLTQLVDPLGRTTSFAYSNQVDLAAISQMTALGVETTIAQFIYNTRHRPLIAMDAAGATTTYSYNAAGQVTSVTNALNQTTHYAYDTLGRLTTITNANGVTAASFTYDAFEHIATATDSEGYTLTYAYDAADRITRITYPDGTTNQFAYNGTDQTTAFTDAKGNVTHWAYDIEGRLTTKTYADTSTLTTTYETTTSRVKSVTDALGQIKQFAYALDDRPTGITYQNAAHATPNVSFSYDAWFPRLTAMTDGTGTSLYTYRAVGAFSALQRQQETLPVSGTSASATITYGYDALGRVTSRTVAGSGSETFQYDAIGRLITHGSDLGSFNLAYLGQTGQITSRALSGSSLATTWTYLPNSGDRRLAGIANAGLSSGQYTNFTFTTNVINQITGLTQSSDATAATPTAASQTATFNALNQISTLNSQSYSYDANGNLTSDGTRTYTWDAENRLIGVATGGSSGQSLSFSYDGFGRRTSIATTPSGGSTVTSAYL